MWVAAFAAAAYPTWDRWRCYLFPPDTGSGWVIYGQVRLFSLHDFTWQDVYEWSLLRSLLADVHTVVEFALDWGLLALGVLVLAARRRSAVAGRRAAAVLTLVAVLVPLDPPAASAVDFAPLDVRWWADVADRMGETTTVALLSAAVLVLLVTQVPGPERDRRSRPTASLVARRALGALIDYWLVTVLVSVAVGLTKGGLYVIGPPGLLAYFRLSGFVDDPSRLLLAALVIGYVLSGRTLGIRLMGLRRRPSALGQHDGQGGE
ncbi:hypothetical protein C1J01_33295 [Nonomuraea aridisoli]|uniref:Uncharacterized protein n=1 Tax=Nonomuraea aridisoli TaxID=2070368 RepID=A0A2W2DNN4_9ACTN|nr:hypothetical protein C1J01_33295 [Nonomuraea aridisoli]